MNKWDAQDIVNRNKDNWSKYMDGNDVDIARRSGVQDEKEYFFQMTPKELDECILMNDRVLISIDEMLAYEHGTLKLVLPESISDSQHDTFHKPVSGIMYKQSCGIPKGTRVFFHYLSIIQAKLQEREAGIFIQCEKKGYLMLQVSKLYLGIIDGEPIALHPDFCITEAIERKDVEMVESPDGVKFLATKTVGGLYLGESLLNTKTYEKDKCKIVALPSRDGMDEHRLENMRKVKRVGDVIKIGAEVQQGDTILVGKSWDIPLENGVQKFFGDRKLFRTRIAAIKEIL